MIYVEFNEHGMYITVRVPILGGYRWRISSHYNSRSLEPDCWEL